MKSGMSNMNQKTGEQKQPTVSNDQTMPDMQPMMDMMSEMQSMMEKMQSSGDMSKMPEMMGKMADIQGMMAEMMGGGNVPEEDEYKKSTSEERDMMDEKEVMGKH